MPCLQRVVTRSVVSALGVVLKLTPLHAARGWVERSMWCNETKGCVWLRLCCSSCNHHLDLAGYLPTPLHHSIPPNLQTGAAWRVITGLKFVNSCTSPYANVVVAQPVHHTTTHHDRL